MKKTIWLFLLLAVCAGFAAAQTPDFTMTRSDATTVRNCSNLPCKAGLNGGTPQRSDSANWYRNILQGDNHWNFEPFGLRQVLVQNIAAAANQIVMPPYFTVGGAVVPGTTYAGATIDITAVPLPGTSAELSCHATVAGGVPYHGIGVSVGAYYALASLPISIASNVITVTVANSFGVGEVVAIQGLTTATYLNGAFLTITAASSSSFSAAFTHANASLTDTGWIDEQAILNLSSSCGAATQAGDVFTLSIPAVTTPSATWTSTNGVFMGSGATMYTETAAPYHGAQSLGIDTTPTGAYASFPLYSEGDTHDLWHVLNGTWTGSVALKSISGTGSTTLQVFRGGTVECSATFTPTTAWLKYSWTCTPNETPSTAIGLITVVLNQPQGTNIEYDDVSFAKTSGRSSTNLTPFSDEVLASDCYFDGGCSPTVWGLGRAWEGQHGETFANWIKPAEQAANAGVGDATNASYVVMAQLPDILERYREEHRIPSIVIPSTFLDTEVASTVTWLATTQTGMTQPWVGAGGIFPMVHLELGNEEWNGSFVWQNIGYRHNDYTQYSDYLNRIGLMIKAGRQATGYTSSAFQFIGNVQAVNSTGITSANGAGTEYAHMQAIGGAPDGWEAEGYKQSSVSDFDTESDQWLPGIVEGDSNFFDTANPRQQTYAAIKSMNMCGASGTALCKLIIYEQGPNTLNTCTSGCSSPHNVAITQTPYGQVVQGAGQAIEQVVQAIVEIQNGVTAASTFAANGYGGATGPGGLFFHGWHEFVDFGGAASVTNASLFGGQFMPGPGAIGMNMLNKTIIGRVVQCNNALPASFAGSNNGPLNALANVPTVYTLCSTDDAGNYTELFVNADLANSHVAGFAGSNPPTGTVQVSTLALSSLNLMNEVSDASATSTFAAQVLPPTSSTLVNPTALSMAARSMVALSWTTNIAVPPVSKQSTGAVINSGAVSELLTLDPIVVDRDSEAVLLHSGRGLDAGLLLQQFDQF